jgi:hypothetical protein
MKLQRLFLILCLAAMLPAWNRLPPPAQPTAITPDPHIQAMLDQVQSNWLYDKVAGLSGKNQVSIGGNMATLVTRYTSNQTYSQLSTQYVAEYFQSLGLATSYQTWAYSKWQGRNVVAEQPGQNSFCIYLITAHVDDYSQSASSLAPGADDNASGTVGVMAAASILSKHHFTCTLRYVIFTGEEQGLYGSEAYAVAAHNRGDPILGVLNLDMIGFNTLDSDADLELNIRSGTSAEKDRPLSNMVADVIQAYQLPLIPHTYATSDSGSDQYSFWQVDYPAVFIIEDWDDSSPYYHKTTDTVDYLNMPYYTAMVKAAIGTAAHLAQLITEPPAPQNNRIYLPLARKN